MTDNFDDYFLKLKNEYNRLNNLHPFNKDSSVIVSYSITSNCSAEQIIVKTKEVLQTLNVICTNNNIFPTPEEWKLLLPSWFIEKCKPERSEQQVLDDLNRWENLGYEQKLQYIDSPERTWELSAWIEYFRPEQRQWYWYNYSIVSINCFILSVEVEDLPFSSGSFYWLLKASGATEVKELDD